MPSKCRPDTATAKLNIDCILSVTTSAASAIKRGDKDQLAFLEPGGNKGRGLNGTKEEGTAMEFLFRDSQGDAPFTGGSAKGLIDTDAIGAITGGGACSRRRQR